MQRAHACHKSTLRSISTSSFRSPTHIRFRSQLAILSTLAGLRLRLSFLPQHHRHQLIDTQSASRIELDPRASSRSAIPSRLNKGRSACPFTEPKHPHRQYPIRSFNGATAGRDRSSLSRTWQAAMRHAAHRGALPGSAEDQQPPPLRPAEHSLLISSSR